MDADVLDFGNLDIDSTDEMLGAGEIPDPEAATKEYDAPSPDMVEKPKRSRTAIEWENRAKRSLGKITRVLLARPATVPDGAAFLYHGPAIAEAWGDLAADNERVAKMIEMLESGTDSPTLALLVATAPLAMQLVRNHEPVLEPKPRTLRVGKYQVRIPLPKVGVKLGVLRPLTNDPNALVAAAFSDEKLVDALKRNKVHVAEPRNWRAQD